MVMIIFSLVESLMFRAVFWVVLPCKMIVDRRFRGAYNPEDSSEHHTRRRENLKSHTVETCSAECSFF
jgi:hypothetical protein